MSGRRSRNKGTAGEQEVARILREAGIEVDRVPNSGGLKVKGDLTGLEGFHVEVKRKERLDLWKCLEQARTEAPEGDTPLLVFRRNRSEWQACLPLADLIELLRELNPKREAPWG